MKILVAYASKYGATGEIAERVAATLRAAGHQAQARPVAEAGDLSGYDAFVIGAAAYFGRWLKKAMRFAEANRAALTDGRPVWLFSSGPLGSEPADDEGNDLRTVAIPGQVAAFANDIGAREVRCFFGALSPAKLGLRDRMIKASPAGRTLLPEGDFRDWADIESWAAGIARDLATASTG